MAEKEIHQHRKDEHLSLALKYWKNGGEQAQGVGFRDIRFIPETFPELALDEVNLSLERFGTRFEFPFYIEAITGGSERGDKLNVQLAEAAARQHLALAVGSQSIALKFPELAAGFKKVREVNPDGFIFANLGAGHSLEHAKRAVDMLAANALEIHVNSAQELTMRDSEGDRQFYWLENVNEIAEKLDVPVIVKEVGFGMSQQIFSLLAQTKVAAINVGGKGGTNFAWIERERGGKFELTDYGMTTVESLLEAQFARNSKLLIATGGITCAADMVKSQLLGADLASSAGFILQVLMKNGATALDKLFEAWKTDLARFYALLGVRNLTELQQKSVLFSLEAQNFIAQRQNL